MSVQSIDIERVVREVLAELSAGGTAPPNAWGGSKAAPDKSLPPPPAEGQGEGSQHSSARSSLTRALSQSEKQTASDGDLPLDACIVTMNEIVGRLASIRRLTVPRKAIVTPAVQDELLRRGIELVRADSRGAEAAAAPHLTMICSGVDFDPQPLVAVLAREGVKVEHAISDCLIAATEQLAAELADANTLGLLLTEHTAAGLCLANRRRGLRAVTGLDAPAVAASAAAVGANLLVLNPCAGSFFQVKQMVTEFCRGGVRPCPEVFRPQLD
jgi:hypothetical protein